MLPGRRIRQGRPLPSNKRKSVYKECPGRTAGTLFISGIYQPCRVAVHGIRFKGASSRGYMLCYQDLRDPSVKGVYRLLAKIGDGRMKMRIVRLDFAE